MNNGDAFIHWHVPPKRKTKNHVGASARDVFGAVVAEAIKGRPLIFLAWNLLVFHDSSLEILRPVVVLLNTLNNRRGACVRGSLELSHHPLGHSTNSSSSISSKSNNNIP